MSVLEQAYMDLRSRAGAAFDADDWQEGTVLEALAGVADYVHRIGDHPQSAHYRAEKAGLLVDEAVLVLRKCFLAYAAWPEDDDQERAIIEAVEALDAARRAVQLALWVVAYPGGRVLVESTAADIRMAAGDFGAWVDAVTADPAPDPEGDW